MAYCVQADVELRVGGAAKLVQLTAPPGGTVVDAVRVADAIDEAGTLIDSYAHKRFTVPFSGPPPRIKALAARIAARLLRQWRTMPLPSDVTDEEIDIKWLEALAAGKVDPGVDPSPDPSSMTVDSAEPRESTKEVSREALKGFW